MSHHLSLRINDDDEHHLHILEQTLGFDRSEATRFALSIAADYINQKKTDKLLLLRESEFIGADDSKKVTRIGYRQKVKAKLEAKYGMEQKKKPHH